MGAQSLIYIVSWSSIRNLYKIVELRAGNEHPKQTVELVFKFGQLSGYPIKSSGGSSLNRDHVPILDRDPGAHPLK